MSNELKRITEYEIRSKPYASCTVPYFYNNQYTIVEINTGRHIGSIKQIHGPYKDLKTLLDTYNYNSSDQPFLHNYILEGGIKSQL
jgi:hypothetical protein